MSKSNLDKDKTRTIGISKTNIDFFNKYILNIEKLLWDINKIEIYSESFNNEKILNICGHYHPKIILRSFNDRISFKCFALDSYNNNLYLPSFGDLTGGYLCKKHFKKWPIISENKIIELK